MSVPTPPSAKPGSRRGWLVRAAAGLVVATCLTVATGFWMARRNGDSPESGTPVSTHPVSTPQVGGVPIFGAWPKDRSPELVLVLTGQTYGYLSPCGCSRPQKGGLERRANFMDSLRAKGWTVVGLDLGDAAPAKGPHGLSSHKQDLLKYKTTMRALAVMGYQGIGLGEYDFAEQLFDLLAQYTLNNPGKPPIVLAGNLAGVAERDPTTKKVTKKFSREEYFPGGPGARPMIEAVELIAPKDKPVVGVVGVVGPDVEAKVEKLDSQFAFLANPQFLPAALAALDNNPVKPNVRVLLYAGKLDKAKELAKTFPRFDLILCQSDDPEPPQFPTVAGNTQIVQVGHKGQNVGVVGVFKKPGGGYELKYQLVPLGEEYLTPDGAEAAKNNKVLQLLEEYTAEVKKQDLLAEFRRRPNQHPAQIQQPNAKLTFVGSQACAACHAAEYKKYAETKHSHAYDALVHAKRPSNQQFNGECIVCHTVGFEYVGGFESADKTPLLKNVGCENCHGPGSGHAANPRNPAFLQLLSPWKAKPGDKLPDVAFLKKLAETKPLERGALTAKLPASQQQVMNAVQGMCMKCHDTENDPKFEFSKYMPQIYHTGMKTAGLPVGAK